MKKIMVFLMFVIYALSVDAQFGSKNKKSETFIPTPVYSYLVVNNDSIKCRRTSKEDIAKLFTIDEKSKMAAIYLKQVENELEKCKNTVENKRTLTYIDKDIETNLTSIKNNLPQLDLKDYNNEYAYYKSIQGKKDIKGVTTQEYLTRGNFALMQWNYDDAIFDFTEYLKSNPNDTTAIRKRAESGLLALSHQNSRKSKYIQSTINDYNLLINTYNRTELRMNIVKVNHYAGLYYLDNEPQKAIPFYEESLKILKSIELENGKTEESTSLKNSCQSGLESAKKNNEYLISVNSLLIDLNKNLDNLKLTEDNKNDLIINIKTIERLLKESNTKENSKSYWQLNDALKDIKKILSTIDSKIYQDNISTASQTCFENLK